MAVDALVDARERTLARLTLILGLGAWLLLLVGTFGLLLLALALGYLIYLFAHSALIAHLRGNAVEITAQQRPELHQQLLACCERLGLRQAPRLYLLNGEGLLNAFATRFRGTEYVVLLSATLDAMATHPDGVRFYIGHELGHLRRRHLQGQLLRWPALWLPLLGAAYSRSRERSCDLHGAACCASPAQAGQALMALAAGGQQWQGLDAGAYLAQARSAPGFWMSFHGVISGYPWVTERVARVVDPGQAVPARHPLAWLPALLVPFGGRLGGGFSALVMVYVVAVLAAVALPAYHDYTVRARLTQAYEASDAARKALAAHYEAHHEVPPTLSAIGLPEVLPGELALSLDSEHMVLSVHAGTAGLVFTPELDKQGRVQWSCAAGEDTRPAQRPAECR